MTDVTNSRVVECPITLGNWRRKIASIQCMIYKYIYTGHFSFNAEVELRLLRNFFTIALFHRSSMHEKCVPNIEQLSFVCGLRHPDRKMIRSPKIKREREPVPSYLSIHNHNPLSQLPTVSQTTQTRVSPAYLGKDSLRFTYVDISANRMSSSRLFIDSLIL